MIRDISRPGRSWLGLIKPTFEIIVLGMLGLNLAWLNFKAWLDFY
jgi:hypothetical protein